MGLLDTAKGAIHPDEPLSLEHWMNSAALAGIVVGSFEFGKTAIEKSAAVMTRRLKRKGVKAGENIGDNVQNNFPSASELVYSDTVQKHFYDPIRKGKKKGESSRPYLDPRHSNLIADEIMNAGVPRKDFMLPNGYRWDVHGMLNGSYGTWELVVNLDTNMIVHFNFVTKQ